MTAEIFAAAGLFAAALLWLVAATFDLFGRLRSARWLFVLAGVFALGGVVSALQISQPVPLATGVFAHWPWVYQPHPAALWLLLPALLPAIFAVFSAVARPRGWVSGAALSMLGTLGILGVSDGVSLLIAWEALSLGGAVMLLSERATTQAGRDNLFMLSLLEVGSVALLLAVLLLGSSVTFSSYAAQWQAMAPGIGMVVAVLWLIGFGAKLGLLPFYEWYPGAYAQGSGASGAIMSGAILNMAYFALGRALLDWLGTPPWLMMFGIGVLAVGTLTAVLAILYAFQQNDWRRLLAFSSAENAAVAVTALGVALIFRAGGQPALAELAWLIGVLHLMGHSLAKGALFFTADAVAKLQGGYQLRQSGVLRQAPWTLGTGALFAAMSLAAMPPTAGFVSEWFLFQSVFHDFTLTLDGARIALALAGAGLALTAAIALATMTKLFGVGLLGQTVAETGGAARHPPRLPALSRIGILLVGLAVPALAVSLVLWLPALGDAGWLGSSAAHQMVDGRLLVPLSAHFAFISPAALVVVMPFLALIPLLLLASRARFAVRRAPLWCGGEAYAARSGATTSLAFSNALRVFYSFVYRPTNTVSRQFEADKPYFLRELRFDYAQAPVFGAWLFQPAVAVVRWLTQRLAFLQNGWMNAYLAYIGVLLVVIFAVALFWSP